ncbi:MAG: hypothetical protein A3K10_03750 [Bacteroidetes bacterium RIFCSPLOWO2_12_FULL_31_6]|nr:MAG: hypothetical protein A3K10_03750 [Bacteroidetes bacterium RIFCSPLOWO2_12_FULL_31_6]
MKKVNTNINRPEISSEEIIAGKDFDKLYTNFTKVTKPFFKQNWFIANSIIVVVAAIVVSTILLNNSAENTSTNVEPVAQNTTLISEQIAAVETKPQAFVNPPIAGLNVPFSSYFVQNNQGKTLKHKTGSFIKIPKDAFVNEKGDLIKGKVEIKYREFKDVAEIFASGIPMTYKENGEEFHFESAGMIEILAYQDGKQVFMNPKKKIDIEMTSDYAGTQYNLYSLDTTARNWVYEGKDKVIVKKEEEDRFVENVNPIIDDKFESQPIEMATTPEKNSELKVIKEELVVIQKDIEKIKKTAPEKPVKATEKRFRFNLDVDKKEFPEMSVYEGLEFEIGKENKDFDPKLTSKEWHDISLSKNKEEKYVLTLKRYLTDKETENSKANKDFKMDVKEFIVYPVYEGQNYTDAMKDFTGKFDTYSKKLTTRKEDERIKKEEYEKKLAAIIVENERLRKEWEANASKRQLEQQTTDQIYRTFTVLKLGTYNCDSPAMWPQGQTVLASFMDSLKNKLEITSLYLVEKNKNAFFNYNYINKFRFNPNSKNILIGVTSDNKLITFSYQQFKKIPRNVNEYDFNMQMQESTPENINELKQCISFL